MAETIVWGGVKEPVKVAIEEHGEIGPMLVDADQKFSEPKT